MQRWSARRTGNPALTGFALRLFKLANQGAFLHVFPSARAVLEYLLAIAERRIFLCILQCAKAQVLVRVAPPGEWPGLVDPLKVQLMYLRNAGQG